MSTLLKVINDYRSRLLLGEKDAVRILNAAHAQTLASIQPALDRLYKQMMDAMANGEKLPVSFLYEAGRLEVIKQLITGQINQFGALSLMTTGRLQQNGLTLGQEAALAMLRSTVPPGVAWSFGVPSMHAIQNLVGATSKGSPLADLFDGFGREAAQKAADALITGVTLGENPRTIAPRIRDALNISRYRALTISRTESIRSYRLGSLETMRQNDDVLDGWVWTAALGRACAVCTAMNGTKHSLDETMDSHPNCACVMSPLSKSWAELLSPLGIDTSDIPDSRIDIESGSDWFDRQSVATQKDILGSQSAYALYASGKVTLKDFVGWDHSKEWGRSIKQKPVKDLVKAGK